LNFFVFYKKKFSWIFSPPNKIQHTLGVGEQAF
jgi:hypothetical protein